MARKKNADANRDPITKTPGAHPVGVGTGAASAGAAGAAIGGAVGGPVGAVVGAAVGAVAGGLGGKAAAEAVNPTIEDTFWRDEYRNRPYAAKDESYEHWRPAYRYGWEAHMMHGGSSWDQIEPQLRSGWMGARGESKLEWERAREAAREAFERPSRVQRAFDTIRDDLHPKSPASHTGEPATHLHKDPLDK